MRLPPHPPTSHSAHFQKVPRQLKKGLWKQWHSYFTEHASCTGEAVQGRKQRKPVIHEAGRGGFGRRRGGWGPFECDSCEENDVMMHARGNGESVRQITIMALYKVGWKKMAHKSCIEAQNFDNFGLVPQ